MLYNRTSYRWWLKSIGAVDEFGIEYRAKAVVLTTGTSLEGRIFVGLRSYSAGRLGKKPQSGFLILYIN